MSEGGRSAPAAGSRREAAVVLAFAASLAVPFLGAAFHMDETYFLAIARHILEDPSRPLGFVYNWYGYAAAVERINTQPLAWPYALAAAWAASGGSEAWLRACLLPLDLLAAASVYGLAAAFLRRPLIPALAVLASPAYFLSMRLALAEKPAFALGFAGLWLLVLGEQRGRRGLRWAAAGLLAASLLSKYSAVCLLVPAVGFLLHRGVRPREAAGFAAAVAAPMVCALAAGRWAGHGGGTPILELLAQGAASPAARWAHRSRALGAFLGGCALPAAAWAVLPSWDRRDRAVAAALAVCACALYSPLFDAWPVAGADRAWGALLAWGGLFGLWRLGAARARISGWELWAPWAAAVVVLQGFVYWSVVGRFLGFLVPALVLGSAAALERALPERASRRAAFAGLVATACLSLCLGAVDAAYARAQEAFAQEARRAAGTRPLWFNGHWGLQFYMERVGARPIDALARGWDAVGVGDFAAVTALNTNAEPPPPGTLLAARSVREAAHPLPLRLMSAKESEAAFYSSLWGFLPFAWSREALDRLVVYERLASASGGPAPSRASGSKRAAR